MSLFARNAWKLSLNSAQKCRTSHTANTVVKKSSMGWVAAGLLAAGGLTGGVLLTDHLDANDGLAPTAYPWEHKKMLSSLDHNSMRRGFEVYRQVCAACHSINQIAYRNLVGTLFTEEEARALAESNMVTDGPGEDGKMFERPGKLSDYLPAPYPNEEAARWANNGAYPPDLSLITSARNDGENYVFNLLLGYLEEPPAGIELREGQHFNVYFPGGAIGMTPPLYDEIIEYTDGTPATKSQLAKDVVTFLKWCAEPEFDDRKRLGMKAVTLLSIMMMGTLYWKRFKWSVLKTRKMAYVGR